MTKVSLEIGPPKFPQNHPKTFPEGALFRNSDLDSFYIKVSKNKVLGIGIGSDLTSIVFTGDMFDIESFTDNYSLLPEGSTLTFTQGK